MKLLLITYDAIYDDSVMEILESSGVEGFTKWEKVLGKGKNSEPKLDSAVWPGFNCAVFTAAGNEEQERVMEALREFSSQVGGRGFKVFVLPVLEVI